MIDYALIGRAVDYYKAKGYQYIEVPWLIARRVSVEFTAPPGARLFETWAGWLVASGEQSFADMRLIGNLPDGRHCCVTPCFRDEPVHDHLHRRYFLKLELIEIFSPDNVPNTLDIRLDIMRLEAEEFMRSNGVPVQYQSYRDKDGHLAYDLLSPGGIELGSYGRREHLGATWLYGTGVAEPRFSIARGQS